MDDATERAYLEAPIEVILGKWPKVARVFISNRTGCIGCAFAKFHTLYDACEIYQLDCENILGQIQNLLNTEEEQESRN